MGVPVECLFCGMFCSNNYLTVDLFVKELVWNSVAQEKAYEYPNLLSKWSMGNSLSIILQFKGLEVEQDTFKSLQFICNRAFFYRNA